MRERIATILIACTISFWVGIGFGHLVKDGASGGGSNLYEQEGAAPGHSHGEGSASKHDASETMPEGSASHSHH